MTSPRRAALFLGTGALALALLATGCARMPEDGPVHETDTSGDASEAEASSIDAVPPRPKAPPADIVKGFIDALSAWPIQLGVAKQYLSEDAAGAWQPGRAMITYTGALPPEVSGNSATVELSGAERLDASGAWQGEVPEADQTLHFDLAFENGEYRITNPRDALIVPSSWFAQRFRQVSLYFFDRTGQILVPEPVFVPRGDQLTSTLVARLLDGPGATLAGVSRSYLPTLDAGLSVPVTDQGVAEIELAGGVTEPQNPDDVERMFAQLGWTLGQVPGIRSLRLTIGGEEVRPPRGDGEYGVNEAQQFDPAGASANPLLYGLRDGLLVYGEPDTLAPAPGPLGETPQDLRSVAVNLDASEAVGVTSDGTSLVRGPVRSDGEGRVRTLDVGGTDLLRPAWDFTDRVWLVDRTASGARVGYLARGRLVPLRVPGVSGRRVRDFLVSRDGTRFVAVVRGPRGDRVRAGRILVDEEGKVDRARPTREIRVEGVERDRITDIAWTSPTSIVVVRPVSREQSEIRTLAVDGAPTAASSLSSSVRDRVRSLAAAPDDSVTPYAVTADALVDLETGAVVALEPVVSLTYVG